MVESTFEMKKQSFSILYKLSNVVSPRFVDCKMTYCPRSCALDFHLTVAVFPFCLVNYFKYVKHVPSCFGVAWLEMARIRKRDIERCP